MTEGDREKSKDPGSVPAVVSGDPVLIVGDDSRRKSGRSGRLD